MTTTAQVPCDHHPGVPTDNHPDRDKVCQRCGRRIDGGDIPRDLDREREWTKEVTRAWHIDVDDLIAFSERRSDKGPVRDLPNRDFLLETREELADARNYLCWRMAQLYRQDDLGEEVGMEIQRAADALRAVALAYSVL